MGGRQSRLPGGRGHGPVRASVEDRSRRYDDAELLALLSELLRATGALSSLVTDECEAMPSSSVYGTQRLLAQAYAEKKRSGGKLAKVRRLLDARRRRGREADDNPFGTRNGHRRPTTTDALMRVYKREADRQRVFVKKSEFAQSRLLFVVAALKILRADKDFANLLRAEHLDAMPADIDRRISGGKA